MKEINTEEFNEVLENDDRLKVVDFHAEWCAPCKVFGPVFESISEDFDDVDFFKMEIDEDNRQTALEYSIRTIPTVLIFKNGEVVEQIVGSSTREYLIETIQSLN